MTATIVLALSLIVASGGPAPAAPGAAELERVERHDVAVYFLRGETLAPASRRVVGRAVAAAAVRSLLRGPSAAEARARLSSAVPRGTRLRSVAIAAGTATVDLSGAFGSGGGSLSLAARLAQMTYTLTQFRTVRRVVYRLDGRRIRTLGGEGLPVDGPQSRALYEHARRDSLEASLLDPIFVDTPAQGARFADPLRVAGTATRTFTITVARADGRVVARRTVPNPTRARRPFSLSIPADSGRSARGTLIVRESGQGGHVIRIPLGTP